MILTINDSMGLKDVYEKSLQKQPTRDVLVKICSENMQQIYKKAPMPCDFNKVAKQTSFLKKTSGRLLPGISCLSWLKIDYIFV